MADFAIDTLTSNSNSRVVIALPLPAESTTGHPSGGSGRADSFTSVIGYTKGDFAFNLANEFNNPEINSGQQNLTNMVNGVTQFLNQWFNTQRAQERIQHPGQTINSWIGSSRPVFSVPLMFVAIRPGDDVRDSVKALARAVSPTIVGSGYTQRYRAPLGYAPTFGRSEISARGTIALEIGRWFRANQLVMRESNFSFSTITTPAGLPLWAEGSVTLEPFQAVTIDDVMGYFRNL